MESRKRILRNRKPLSDCTNTAAPSQSSASTFPSAIIKPPKPILTSPLKEIVNFSNKGQSSSATLELTSRNLPSSNPSSDSLPPEASSTPPRLPISSSNSGTVFEVPEPRSFYSRRRPANKRKNLENEVVPLSCFTASKIQNSLGKENRDGNIRPSQARTVPCKKRQRPTISREGVTKIEFPQDFVEKQRAYFSEVDAFELPVEEAKSSESE